MKLNNGLFVIAGVLLLSAAIWHRTSFHDSTNTDPPPPILTRPISSPRLPVPQVAARMSSSEAPSEESPVTNTVARLLSSTMPSNLSSDQLEPYLQQNNRSVESLLTAFRLTGRAEFLHEAAEKFPRDPRVAFSAIYQSQVPEERRQWLDSFKQSSPANPLVSYLSALSHLKAGQNDQAIQDLIAATRQPRWQDYIIESIQSSEEAYLAAGYTLGEAKALSTSCLALPALGDLRELSRRMNELAGLYQQTGDSDSAQAILQMGISLGQRVSQASGNPTLIQDLVGLAIERQMLAGMDPAGAYDDSGRTIQNRLDELNQHRDDIKKLGQQSDTLLKSMSETDLILYFDRLKLHGEESALRWALNRQPQP